MKKTFCISLVLAFAISFSKAQDTKSIQYIPNFPLDAWKIEKLTLTLEFKDLAGNSHPSMSKVIIPFTNASKILRRGNEQDQFLTVKTDRFLFPIN